MTNKEKTMMKQISSVKVLLGMAEGEEDKKDALWFARRAHRLEPDNLDAERMMAELSAKDDVQYLRKLELLIPKADQWMENNGFMESEVFTHYWEIPETRPYVRLRLAYAMHLTQMGIYGKAIAEAEELMWLCPRDELRVRDLLISLYAVQGEAEKAEALYASDEQDCAYRLLPMALLYYRKGDLKNARRMLERMWKVEPKVTEWFEEMGGIQVGDDEEAEKSDAQFAFMEKTASDPSDAGAAAGEACGLEAAGASAGDTPDLEDAGTEAEDTEDESYIVVSDKLPLDLPEDEWVAAWEDPSMLRTGNKDYLTSLYLAMMMNIRMYINMPGFFMWGYYVMRSAKS